MGWCQEFGVQIRPGCGHPMVATSQACVCETCGTTCTGHFGGCPDVWARAVDVELSPTRVSTSVRVVPEDYADAAETYAETYRDDTAYAPPEEDHAAFVPPAAVAHDEPPARPLPDLPAARAGGRNQVLDWMEENFAALRDDVARLTEVVAYQQTLLDDATRGREAEARIVELADTLPQRLGQAIAAAIEARQEAYLRRFDEVVNSIGTQLAVSLPQRLGTAIADAVEERQEVLVRLLDKHSENLRDDLAAALSDALSASLAARISHQASTEIEAREHAVVARIDELIDGVGARLAGSIAAQLGPALLAATDAGQEAMAARVQQATADLRASLADVHAAAEELRSDTAHLQHPSSTPDRGRATVTQAVDRAVHQVLRRAGATAGSMSDVGDGNRADHDDQGDRQPTEEQIELARAKAALRTKVWREMTRLKVARFPGADGRIPNFAGAEAAADRLQRLDEWQAAGVLKANPDAPQWPVRERALADGKIIYMAVPRLASDEPFYVLDPDELEETPRRASSIKGAERVASTAGLDDLEPVDMVVTGCVAVGRDGVRLGKGGGYSDLEFALLTQAGVIGPETVVVTTAHPLQVQDEDVVPAAPHDLRVDFIVTPDEVIRCRHGGARRRGRMRWDQLSEEQLASIPVLRELRPA